MTLKKYIKKWSNTYLGLSENEGPFLTKIRKKIKYQGKNIRKDVFEICFVNSAVMK